MVIRLEKFWQRTKVTGAVQVLAGVAGTDVVIGGERIERKGAYVPYRPSSSEHLEVVSIIAVTAGVAGLASKLNLAYLAVLGTSAFS